jgi:hypothetical protein
MPAQLKTLHGLGPSSWRGLAPGSLMMDPPPSILNPPYWTFDNGLSIIEQKGGETKRDGGKKEKKEGNS